MCTNKEHLNGQVKAEPRCLIDVNNIDQLPKRFRMTAAPVQAGGMDQPNLAGLAELQASGSGMFSEKGLHCMNETIGHKPLMIIDLRQESHGFVNGMAVSWYGLNNNANKNLRDEEVRAEERRLLDALAVTPAITFDVLEGKSIQLEGPVTDPKQVLTEEELVTGEGFGYQRFFVSDHHRPLDVVVDQFITFVKALSPGVWLHFHCRGGVGRTTSFLLMYDMLRNVGIVTKEDIMRRHIQIGGKDMTDADPNDALKYGPAMERLAFIHTFYEYCIHNYRDGYSTCWSDWQAIAESAS
ncbi:protein-tyrosine-phosphatase [Paenibacillus marchantiophytorum]|uniref:Protein-tyrosine-phosphatase n=1 Tax=Paenibacillus marchantiophytorum TaxID=1619310 RepID=A0ABQ2BQ16_9BACL|nr:protein tyrosine phosphatase [Paenibacillus marchantiophytorum]GGI44829.1 protein-tyrosine-phosphatase [Paenibacillus marchantiophytorum]